MRCDAYKRGDDYGEGGGWHYFTMGAPRDMSRRFSTLVHQKALPPWAIGRPQHVVKSWLVKNDFGVAAAKQPGYMRKVPGTSQYLVAKSDATLAVMLRARMLDKKAGSNMCLAAYKASLPDADKFYSTDIAAGTCTCGDHTTNATVCKHMFTALHFDSRLTFNSLPAALLGQPHHVVDPDYAGDSSIYNVAEGNGEGSAEQATLLDHADPSSLYEDGEDEARVERDAQPTTLQAAEKFREMLVELRTASFEVPEEQLAAKLGVMSGLLKDFAPFRHNAGFIEPDRPRSSKRVKVSRERDVQQPQGPAALSEFQSVRGPGRPKTQDKSAFPSTMEMDLPELPASHRTGTQRQPFSITQPQAQQVSQPQLPAAATQYPALHWQQPQATAYTGLLPLATTGQQPMALLGNTNYGQHLWAASLVSNFSGQQSLATSGQLPSLRHQPPQAPPMLDLAGPVQQAVPLPSELMRFFAASNPGWKPS